MISVPYLRPRRRYRSPPWPAIPRPSRRDYRIPAFPATARRVSAKGASEPRCPSLRGLKRFGRGEVNRFSRQAETVLAKPSPGAAPGAMARALGAGRSVRWRPVRWRGAQRHGRGDGRGDGYGHGYGHGHGDAADRDGACLPPTRACTASSSPSSVRGNMGNTSRIAAMVLCPHQVCGVGLSQTDRRK